MKRHKERQFDEGWIVQTKSTWKYVWILLVSAADVTLMKFCRQLPGVRSEPTQVQECEVFKWRRRYKRSSMETVISTRMSHKAKRDKAQPRIVTPECARNACIRALREHPMHTNEEVDDQQNDVKVSSTRDMRYVIRVPS